MSSLPHCADQPQSRSRMQQFRVSIRDKQLSSYINGIRQEMLRSNAIEDLLQQVPRDGQGANCWAAELYHAYAQTRRYSLSIEHIIDIFKLVERFPNRNTLLLFEVVIIRATEQNADVLFQYDVMRVLHGFINFTGQQQLIRCPSSAFSFEESRIINEVVISSAVEAIERNSAEAHNYSSRLEMARISLRIIAELCRKAVHVRNFAVINHKTYTYCLKAHKCFEKDIDNQFYNFLEAATHIAFDRWEDQFLRITTKLLHLFYRAKMSVRIELLAEKDDRSYLLAYESLVLAMRNLFRMDIQWVRMQLEGVENSQGTVTLGMVLDIVSQCNYVMEFPAAHEQNESLMPIRLMEATLGLAMQANEVLSELFPDFLRHPLYDQYASQLIRFLRNREISFGYGSFVIARRMALFQLDQFVFSIHEDQGRISNFISFNPHNPHDNIIALIAYLFQSDTDTHNKTELCILMRNIIFKFPAFTFEPFLAHSELFRIMLDRFVQLEIFNGNDRSSVQALKMNILHVLLIFLKETASQIGDRIHFYISLMREYSQRIQKLLEKEDHAQLLDHAGHLLELLSEGSAEL